ncbi:alpha/beta hydrolase [Lentibacter algarum]|uniref:alpha/beta hydrolase n=1 Tax=Lentibacter algarum TaxID=576131 RepID=UPI001C06AF1F|nr:alpha/beta hydrolase [Lentibacter algarum]MBU2980736.1 alpha/beta hydrolase [Lentibacter algarum]
MLRVLAYITLFSLGGYVAVGLLEQKMIYPFDSTRVSPAKAGVPNLTEKTLEVDGAQLVTWVAAPRGGKPVILYFHGNAGNLANRAGRFRRFTERGYGLVAMAYRGSSGSTGTPSQKAITADVRTLYRHLDRVLKSDNPRVLYGESLGTGVVILGLLASAVTDAEKGAGPPAAVVLEAPYSSILDVALGMSPQLEPLSKFLTSTWESAANARYIKSPLLVIHGTEDAFIPIAQGRKVFAAAATNDKQFLAVKGGGHTDLWRSDVLPHLWRFIDRSSR